MKYTKEWQKGYVKGYSDARKKILYFFMSDITEMADQDLPYGSLGAKFQRKMNAAEQEYWNKFFNST